MKKKYLLMMLMINVLSLSFSSPMAKSPYPSPSLCANLGLKKNTYGMSYYLDDCRLLAELPTTFCKFGINLACDEKGNCSENHNDHLVSCTAAASAKNIPRIYYCEDDAGKPGLWSLATQSGEYICSAENNNDQFKFHFSEPPIRYTETIRSNNSLVLYNMIATNHGLVPRNNLNPRLH